MVLLNAMDLSPMIHARITRSGTYLEIAISNYVFRLRNFLCEDSLVRAVVQETRCQRVSTI